MLLYEYGIRDELGRVRETAERIQAKCAAGADLDDLQHDIPLLETAYDRLQHALPKGVTAGAFDRHVHFVKYYVHQHKTQGCQANIDDICNYDLPAIERAFRDWCASQQHYDSEFAEKVRGLLLEQHLDSAVRKAFVIFKERLARFSGITDDIDGQALVNRVFGNNGCLAGQLSEPELQSMRNLLNGLYGAFRNPYHHRDVEPTWAEAEAVLAMINWALLRLDKYSVPTQP